LGSSAYSSSLASQTSVESRGSTKLLLLGMGATPVEWLVRKNDQAVEHRSG
jgi:hypothetical protein